MGFEVLVSLFAVIQSQPGLSNGADGFLSLTLEMPS
jgi:hypothetical protein